MKPRYYGVAELALVVSDLEISKRFYVDVLGFEPAGVDVGLGGFLLEIGQHRRLGLWVPGAWRSDYLPPDQRQSYFGGHVCPTHPVFAAHNEDIPAIAERLRNAGFSPHGPVRHADGSLHVYVSDPDNHAIEFYGWNDGERP